MTDLAVIIVTWNNADVIVDALQSLLHDLSESGLSSEVWLVDSASSDDTVAVVKAQFADVKLVACATNVGFGASNNLAMRRLGFGSGAHVDDLPRAVYLLNPDTITRLGAGRALYDTLMASADVGVVGARLSFGDGSFQHSAFRFPDLRQIWSEFFPTPGRLLEGGFNGRYPRSRYAGEPFDVDFTLGATMMLKREVVLETGGFDERFFIYCEEVDWAWRIQQRGWRILCVPAAHVTHLGAGSTSQARPRSLINLWQSRLHLYDKYYSPWKRLAARQLVIAGMRRRLSLLGAADADLGRACKRVIEMAKS